ncbi:MAG: hypothetical protein EBU49_00320 [Proteobacteria bacterium]|nr:hypothetical protein [Pseudomonadota bacterium]
MSDIKNDPTIGILLALLDDSQNRLNEVKLELNGGEIYKASFPLAKAIFRLQYVSQEIVHLIHKNPNY